MYRHPANAVGFYHPGNVGFHSIELSMVLLFYCVEEEDIVPYIVVDLYMVLVSVNCILELERG